MTPSRFHVPPLIPDMSPPPGSEQSVCGAPPARSSFLSLPSEEKQIERLSGDQKCFPLTPSVPGSSCAVSEASGRNQRLFRPSAVAAKTRLRPSGESSGSRSAVTFSGAAMVKRPATASTGGDWRRYFTAKGKAASKANTATAATAIQSRTLPNSSVVLVAGKLPVSAGSAVVASSREPEGVVSVLNAKPKSCAE